MIEVHIRVEAIELRGLSRNELQAILQGQLTLIRMRAERGIPVSVESIARAERLARTLEIEELAL